MGKTRTIAELALLVGSEVDGDAEVVIHGLADLAHACEGDISFAVDDHHFALVENSAASAFIVPLEFPGSSKPLIRARHPNLAAAIIHNHFVMKQFVAQGVHPQSSVGQDCTIPVDVTIGPMAVLGDRVRLGERVFIGAGTVVGDDVAIGDDTVLMPNVTLYPGCLLGRRVILHSGVVIGADGFGYASDEKGFHVKRPHVGSVQIDDDVEIGANSCVDRATFGRTWIKTGTKIDNLVMVGHNVVIGENSLLVAQSGIAGSAILGCNVVLGGQSAVKGHIKLGDRVMVAAKAGVHNDQAAGAIVSGMPAIAHKVWLRAITAFAKLPELVKNMRDLKRQVQELSDKLQ
jgi:UDP-3-O-[3-hydroxymyristoyl] glucosamine N-acyltransferase